MSGTKIGPGSVNAAPQQPSVSPEAQKKFDDAVKTWVLNGASAITLTYPDKSRPNVTLNSVAKLYPEQMEGAVVGWVGAKKPDASGLSQALSDNFGLESAPKRVQSQANPSIGQRNAALAPQPGKKAEADAQARANEAFPRSEDQAKSTKVLQNALNHAHFSSGTPDGKFGSKTMGSVRAFAETFGVQGDNLNQLARKIVRLDQPLPNELTAGFPRYAETRNEIKTAIKNERAQPSPDPSRLCELLNRLDQLDTSVLDSSR